MRRILSLLAVVIAATACENRAPEQATAEPTAEDARVLARVAGREIKQSEVDARIRDDLFQREVTSKNAAGQYEARSGALARMIDEIAFEAAAKEKGVTTDALLDAEAAAIGPVGDQEVGAFFEQNRERMGGQPLEAVAPRIREFLGAQRRAQAVANVRSRAGVQVLLEPPRFEVASGGHARGPEAAPVRIVEFSDYQCPFCRRAEPTVDAVLARYEGKVRLEYRHLPLEQIHPRARAASQAAICADAQGKFWDYHRKLFESQQALADADLERYAGELGLDVERFKGCRQDPATDARITADLAAADGLGIDGTPAFLVNGILLSGARPLEEFVRLIDAELARGG